MNSENMNIDLKMFYLIKHNSFPPSEERIPQEDVDGYIKFLNVLKEFRDLSKDNNSSCFSSLSSLMAMFGYNRRYCGMCGKPLINGIQHIQNRMVCDVCYGSYKITEELYKKEINTKSEIIEENVIEETASTKPLGNKPKGDA